MEQIIVLFWLNTDNYRGLLKTKEGKTLEEQLRQYEKDHGDNPNSIIGIYDTIEEQ
jgi:hypothetical protein